MGETFDPKQLTPGTVLRHRFGGTIILLHRWANDCGWWCTDGSRLWDSAAETGDWSIVVPRPVR